MEATGSVFLTFDDGPHPVHTAAVLDVLARHGAAATFFLVGREVERSPELVARICREGHGIGNHTWSHPDLSALDAAAGRAEIASASAAIERAAEAAPRLFRPPYGRLSPSTRADAAAEGLETVLWDVDPNDWDCPGSGVIAANVLDAAVAGAIILLHDGGGDRSQTVTALDEILGELGRRGLTSQPLPGSRPAGAHST